MLSTIKYTYSKSHLLTDRQDFSVSYIAIAQNLFIRERLTEYWIYSFQVHTLAHFYDWLEIHKGCFITWFCVLVWRQRNLLQILHICGNHNHTIYSAISVQKYRDSRNLNNQAPETHTHLKKNDLVLDKSCSTGCVFSRCPLWNLTLERDLMSWAYRVAHLARYLLFPAASYQVED